MVGSVKQHLIRLAALVVLTACGGDPAASAVSRAGMSNAGGAPAQGRGAPAGGGSAAVSGSGALAGAGEQAGAPSASAGTGAAAGGSDAPAGAGGGAGSGGAVADPGTEGDGIIALSQPFKAAPEMSDQAGVAKGQIVSFTLANSKTFADGSRKVAVYLPARYASNTELPFMVAQDGVNPQGGGSFGLDDLRPLLDNMIADGRLPMMAGIFVDPGAQRSVEYDTVSDKYYQFVESELLPAVALQVSTKTGSTLNLTKDPQGRGAFGGSSGGSAAFTMGWFHPEAYTRLLTISGSFVALQKSSAYPDGGADYFMHLIPESAARPLRVFLEAGSNDLANGRWRAANDSTAQALAAKSYHYRYVQAQGAGHEDDAARRAYLPAAMQWLWRGYPPTKP